LKTRRSTDKAKDRFGALPRLAPRTANSLLPFIGCERVLLAGVEQAARHDLEGA